MAMSTLGGRGQRKVGAVRQVPGGHRGPGEPGGGAGAATGSSSFHGGSRGSCCSLVGTGRSRGFSGRRPLYPGTFEGASLSSHRQDLCPIPRAVTGAAVTSEGCVGTPASPLDPAATPGDVPRDAARARAGSHPFQPSAESPTTDWRASLCHQTRAGRATSRRQPLSALGAAWGDGSVNPVPGSGRSCDEGLPRWRPAQGLAEKLPEYWWSGKGPARPGRPSAAQLGTAGLDPGFLPRCRLLRLPYLQVQREWPLCPQTAVLPSGLRVPSVRWWPAWRPWPAQRPAPGGPCWRPGLEEGQARAVPLAQHAQSR